MCNCADDEEIILEHIDVYAPSSTAAVASGASAGIASGAVLFASSTIASDADLHASACFASGAKFCATCWWNLQPAQVFCPGKQWHLFAPAIDAGPGFVEDLYAVAEHIGAAKDLHSRRIVQHSEQAHDFFPLGNDHL